MGVMLAGLMLAMTTGGSAAPRVSHSFTASGTRFLMDGKPYQVISGEMHYVRVPREYWRDRLRKAKAMALNTITTYAFWKAHELRPGVYVQPRKPSAAEAKGSSARRSIGRG